MTYDEKIIGTGLAFVIGAVLAYSTVDQKPEPTVQPISKAEYKAAVGPLLDEMNALCGAEFDAKKFRIDQLPDGRLVCELREVKVAAP